MAFLSPIPSPQLPLPSSIPSDDVTWNKTLDVMMDLFLFVQQVYRGARGPGWRQGEPVGGGDTTRHRAPRDLPLLTQEPGYRPLPQDTGT